MNKIGLNSGHPDYTITTYITKADSGNKCCTITYTKAILVKLTQDNSANIWCTFNVSYTEHVGPHMDKTGHFNYT